MPRIAFAGLQATADGEVGFTFAESERQGLVAEHRGDFISRQQAGADELAEPERGFIETLVAHAGGGTRQLGHHLVEYKAPVYRPGPRTVGDFFVGGGAGSAGGLGDSITRSSSHCGASAMSPVDSNHW